MYNGSTLKFVIQKNQSRGRQGKHPVTFLECKEITAKVISAFNYINMYNHALPQVLAANKVHHTMNYYAGEPYCGLRKEEVREKNPKITELEKENARLRQKVAALEARYEPCMCKIATGLSLTLRDQEAISYII